MAAMVTAIGCAPPATQALLSISSSGLSVPGDFDQLSIEVVDRMAPPPSVLSSALIKVCEPNESGGCNALPLTVLFVPGSDHPEDPARVEVKALEAGMPVVDDLFVISFLPGMTLRYDLVLFAACRNSTCAQSDEVCGSDGKCHTLTPSSPGSDLATAVDAAASTDGAPADLAPAGPPDCGSPMVHHVFLAPAHDGALGGQAGANAMCNAAAQGHLCGNFVALLGLSNSSPIGVAPLNDNRPVVRPDGVQVSAANMFWAYNHAVPMNLMADGTPVSDGAGALTWTSFQFNGNTLNAGGNCGDFGGTGGGAPCGYADSPSGNFVGGGIWANGQQVNCTQPAYLYCVDP